MRPLRVSESPLMGGLLRLNWVQAEEVGEMFLRHLPEAPRACVHVLECTATDEMRAVSRLVH